MQTETEQNTDTNIVDMSKQAVAKALEFIENPSKQFLRVSVAAGGCAGFRYKLSVEDTVLENDVEQKFGELKIHIDSMSAPYLQGTSIDWVENLMSSGFKLDNPNSKTSCACGDSAAF